MTRRTLLASLTSTLALAQKPQPKAGCQANGFPLKPGDFAGLLAALEKMRVLGYTGFECNVRFVRGEFGRVRREHEMIAAYVSSLNKCKF